MSKKFWTISFAICILIIPLLHLLMGEFAKDDLWWIGSGIALWLGAEVYEDIIDNKKE